MTRILNFITLRKQLMKQILKQNKLLKNTMQMLKLNTKQPWLSTMSKKLNNDQEYLEYQNKLAVYQTALKQ